MFDSFKCGLSTWVKCLFVDEAKKTSPCHSACAVMWTLLRCAALLIECFALQCFNKRLP